MFLFACGLVKGAAVLSHSLSTVNLETCEEMSVDFFKGQKLNVPLRLPVYFYLLKEKKAAQGNLKVTESISK